MDLVQFWWLSAAHLKSRTDSTHSISKFFESSFESGHLENRPNPIGLGRFGSSQVGPNLNLNTHSSILEK